MGGQGCLFALFSLCTAACLVHVASAATLAPVSFASTADVAVADKVNSFGLSLLSALRTNSAEGTSVFISPLSLVSALGMVSLGATPGKDAEAELLRALGTDATEAQGFFAGLQQQISAFKAATEVTLLSSNSAWCAKSIKASYSDKAKEVFGAEVQPLPSSAAPINEWCKEATNGLIPTLIEKIEPLTVAMLVNAVYFKGTWATTFSESNTVRSTFKSPTHGPKPCAMMTRTSKMLYAEKGDLQVVELPYGKEDGRFAATVLVPPEGTNLANVVSEFGGVGGAERLSSLLGGLQSTELRLLLPRFKVEFGTRDLQPELRGAFQMKEVFDGTGEFLSMSEDPKVHLSALLHKTVLSVNEEGAEAAAVSAGVIKWRSLPTTVEVDRPFLFLIRDRSTGFLLFAGTVEDPELDTTGV